jgi:AraC-like DNA-binding protein
MSTWTESGTASLVVLRPMLTYARAHGVDVDAILGEMGVTAAMLDDYDHRVPEAQRAHAWVVASEQSRDPLFGMHVARSTKVGAFDVLDYALASASTLGQALDHIVRYHRVLCDAWAVVREDGPDLVRVRRVEVTPRQEAEGLFVFFVHRGRELTAVALPPREVRFAHTAPPDPSPLEAFFRCPVRFGSNDTELLLDTSSLTLPVRTANPGLEHVLERYMNDLLARLPTGDSYVERVRSAVARAMRTGRPTLESTSRDLHASPRTVQRRLGNHGTTHAMIVNAVRREMAERLVHEGRLSMTEIAFLLGFSDVSGFRRIYKRWAGVPPSHHRA